MGFKYTVPFEAVAVTAAQDLISILTAAQKPVRILRYWVGATDTTIPTSQMLSLRARLATATVTLGSGGSVVTAVKIGSQSAPAAGFTAHTNDPTGTKATTSGAFFIQDEQSCHIYNGYDSAVQAREPIEVPANAAGFVFELLSTVSGTVHLSGGIDVEEIGG